MGKQLAGCRPNGLIAYGQSETLTHAGYWVGCTHQL